MNALFRRYWRLTPDMKPHERDFANLVDELFERMLDEELFTFVLNPDVDPTNNLPERLQRAPAQDRNAGRTSKTAAGARRRRVIVSVLESLRASLPEFTLKSVLAEASRWMMEGITVIAYLTVSGKSSCESQPERLSIPDRRTLHAARIDYRVRLPFHRSSPFLSLPIAAIRGRRPLHAARMRPLQWTCTEKQPDSTPESSPYTFELRL